MLSNVQTILEAMDELEKKIGYRFKNRSNLILAITHSSFANENKNGKYTSNERLEFLGDSVLNFVISDIVYKKHAELSEGEMTKVRANIVCEASLLICSNSIELGKYLLLGKGEESTGGRSRASILSDAFEALIGAIYIDGGIRSARAFIVRTMGSIINSAIKGVLFLDYKTQLQETVQKVGDQKIIYEIIDEKGPDHSKIFVSQVKIADRVVGIGEGRSKKEAEQNAAKVALDRGV